MGTTASGLPYPEPSDFIAQGADAIKALAQLLPGRGVHGQVAISAGAGGANTGVAVTFPAALFTGSPRVFCALATGVGGGATDFAFVWASGISSTGCTINTKRSQAGTAQVFWLAIGA
jgi:hypothetical protein